MKLTLVILSLFITSLAWAQTDSIPPVKKEIDFVKQLSETDSITGGKVIIHARSENRTTIKTEYFREPERTAFSRVSHPNPIP